MTLSETIRIIEIVASHQPSVNMIIQNDVYRLNSAPDARYGVFAWLQDQHNGDVREGVNNFSFTFFYVDRLKDDKSNQIEIQSVGFETLGNIIRRLDDLGLDCESFTFQAFNERFLDECSGGFARVTLSVPADVTCAELYPDYGDDYNEDFLIY